MRTEGNGPMGPRFKVSIAHRGDKTSRHEQTPSLGHRSANPSRLPSSANKLLSLRGKQACLTLGSVSRYATFRGVSSENRNFCQIVSCRSWFFAGRGVCGRSRKLCERVGHRVTPQQMIGQPFSRYRVIEVLGSGGMGVVYLAEDPVLNRKVALKVPHPSSTDSKTIRDRFLREARAAAALDHPAICRIYETGEIDGVLFIAMEYVRGATLER